MKIVRMFLWIIICIIFVLGLSYLFTGSLEMYPTPEQQDKARIVSIVMMVIPAICAGVLFSTRKKQENQVLKPILF